MKREEHSEEGSNRHTERGRDRVRKERERDEDMLR